MGVPPATPQSTADVAVTSVSQSEERSSASVVSLRSPLAPPVATSSVMGATRKSRKRDANVAARMLAMPWESREGVKREGIKGSRCRGIKGAVGESGDRRRTLPRALDPRPLDPSTPLYFPHGESRRRDTARLEALHRSRCRPRPLAHRSSWIRLWPSRAERRGEDDYHPDAAQHHRTR